MYNEMCDKYDCDYAQCLEYVLGALWCIGTLRSETSKEKNRFTIQTSIPEKLYYLEFIRDNFCKDIDIKVYQRKTRGKIVDLYTLNFTDKDLARDMRIRGYKQLSLPEMMCKQFLCAVIECSLYIYRTSGNERYTIIRSSDELFIQILHDEISKLCDANYAMSMKPDVLVYNSSGTQRIIDTFKDCQYRNEEYWNKIESHINSRIISIEN